VWVEDGADTLRAVVRAEARDRLAGDPDGVAALPALITFLAGSALLLRAS